MKELKFDANLGFQLEAISAITDIFDGQKVCQSNFTVRRQEGELGFKENTQGYANALQLIDEELLENVHAIQLRNGLEQSTEAMVRSRQFLDLMDHHFKAQYNNTPYDSFVYDSAKLNQVRNFAVSSSIQIMIINIDAFRKVAVDPEKESKANIIHRYHDKMPRAWTIPTRRKRRWHC